MMRRILPLLMGDDFVEAASSTGVYAGRLEYTIPRGLMDFTIRESVMDYTLPLSQDDRTV